MFAWEAVQKMNGKTTDNLLVRYGLQEFEIPPNIFLVKFSHTDAYKKYISSTYTLDTQTKEIVRMKFLGNRILCAVKAENTASSLAALLNKSNTHPVSKAVSI